jgi:PAS domain S-box-containing protein
VQEQGNGSSEVVQGSAAGSPVAAPVRIPVAGVLNAALTLEDAAPKLLERIAEFLGWEIGALWSVEADQQTLRLVDFWHSPGIEAGAFEELSRRINFVPGVGLPGRIWAEGEPCWIPDVVADSNFQRAVAAAQVGLRGAVGAPILGSNGVLGVLEFFTRQVVQPDRALTEGLAAAGVAVGRFVERVQSEKGLRTSAALQSSILDSALECIVAMDHEGRIAEFNPAAERTFGYSRRDAIGQEVAELLIPEHLRERHRRGLARLLAGGSGPIMDRWVELNALRSDGSEFPAEIAISRIGDEDPPSFVACIRDVSEPKRGQEALQFLVRASDALDESLDLETTLETIARLTVPDLADGCMVDLLMENGTIERVASAAGDQTFEPVLDELRRHRIDPEGPHPIAEAMRSGQTQIVPDVSDSFRRDIAANDDYFEALRRWPARSVVVVPMRIRGKVLGTLALAAFSSERSYGAHEVSVAEELARRAANAVENARLFDERTRLARTLRESLLPPRLPEMPGAEVAARFQPAATSTEIGGDFYDAFAAGDGLWAITIGDVSGRGVEAAATTALARHTVRAAAIQGQSPASILQVLNEALLSQPRDLQLCTAVVGLLAFGAAGARLSLASGGHPQPILLHADGSVEPIGGSGTILGVVEEPQLAEVEVNLAIGDTVVFYTDGVTTTPEDEQGSLADLIGIVESCVDMAATSTAASIDRELLEGNRGNLRDDAAVLVLRILEPAEPVYDPAGGTTAEREGWIKARRLAWSRLGGRGDESGPPPSSRAGQSGPRSEDESQRGARHGRRRSEAERS